MSKKSANLSPVVPLLLVAFLATAFVAIKTNSEERVLGSEVENMAPETEIQDVKAPEVPTTRAFQVVNEKGKIKTSVQNRVINLRPNLTELNLRVKESDPSGTRVEDNSTKDVTVSPSGDNQLEIKDQEHSVQTNFPITVNQTDNTISVTTPKGEVKVKDLPSTTIDNLVKNKVFTNVTETQIKTSTDGTGNPVLNVQGTTTRKFLGIFPIRSNTTAEVDPTTGNVTKLNTSWFENTFGFLFSK